MLNKNDFTLDLKLKGVCEKVNTKINYNINEILFSYFESIQYCESPIEQIFAFAVNENLYCDLIPRIEKSGYDLEDYSRQTEIGKYRVDFTFNFKKNNKEKKFAVELDGHEFHQKTKQQVQKDKEKDRFLISEGYTVIRFTGSEVYNYCYDKVIELFYIIEKGCER